MNKMGRLRGFWALHMNRGKKKAPNSSFAGFSSASTNFRSSEFDIFLFTKTGLA